MKRIWVATEGIRYILILCVAIAVTLTLLVGCGGARNSEETVVAEQSWEQEEAEEGYYWGKEAARKANELCEADGGVNEIVISEELGLEVVVCEDGEVMGV